VCNIHICLRLPSADTVLLCLVETDQPVGNVKPLIGSFQKVFPMTGQPSPHGNVNGTIINAKLGAKETVAVFVDQSDVPILPFDACNPRQYFALD